MSSQQTAYCGQFLRTVKFEDGGSRNMMHTKSMKQSASFFFEAVSESIIIFQGVYVKLNRGHVASTDSETECSGGAWRRCANVLIRWGYCDR